MEFGREDWIPCLEMEFQTEEQAWSFWQEYAGKMGFGIRKRNSHKSEIDGAVTSLFFVCSNEGKRAHDKQDDQTKKPQAETRTCCNVRLKLKFNRETKSFTVKDFISEHNHPLQKHQACHLLPSQRKVSEVACCDIDLADNSGIRPKEAHELMGRQVGGAAHIGFTITDHRNYLRDKRLKALISGEAVAMMNYFNRRVLENSSFQHFEQTDEQQEITNILWADAKMIVDYARFGDVVIFDTTFGTNKEYRPFGVFVGFNKFREIVIFGATLMYDQTEASFEWVFKTFVEAHNHKKPKTIFTDQDKAMGTALEIVMPETTHGLCCWHILENCSKHLGRYGKKIIQEFSACMYEYEEEDEFEKAFSDLKEKVSEKNWLPFIYKCKEKWAYCFMKNVLTLGIRSTQLSESINKDLKNYLNSSMDMIRFFTHFERVVAQKRANEIKSDYESKRKLPRKKVDVPILIQAGDLYTTKIFELFQEEYELSLNAQIEGPLDNEYKVTIYELGNVNLSWDSRKVVWNQDDQTVLCACKKFERVGILCWHALKVLDRENIKIIPQHYILKRWTKDANDETVEDRNGTIVIEDTTLDRVKIMSPDSKQLEEKIQSSSKPTNDSGGEVPTTPIVMNDPSQSTPSLKKKDGKKGSKRTKSCTENKQKTNKRKTTHLSTSQAKEAHEVEPEMQRLAVAEAEIAELRQKLEASIKSQALQLNEPFIGEHGCYIDLEDKYDLKITQ